MVEGLLSPEEDRSLLLSQFREYLEHDDIRYHATQAATDTVARVTDRHPEVSGPGRVSGEGAGSGRVESRRSGQAPAGAARFLEQRLHPAVCREPAPPGRSRVQLLREARGCVSRGGGEQGERAARRALHPHSLASRPPPHFAEHSDKWKVMHLKVSYLGERVAASGTGPGLGFRLLPA